MTSRKKSPRVFFTANTHFGDERVLTELERPFNSVTEHDAEIVRRINKSVRANDVLFLLGGLADCTEHGDFAERMRHMLQCVRDIDAYVVLVPGDADPVSPWLSQRAMDVWDNSLRSAMKVWYGPANMYLLAHRDLRVEATLCHFPATQDTADDPLYLRPSAKTGTENIILHGHTHYSSPLTHTLRGQLQVDVGLDAWNYRPVSSREVVDLWVSHNADRTLRP